MDLILGELQGFDLEGDGVGGVTLGVASANHLTHDGLEAGVGLLVAAIRVAVILHLLWS
jgi:hypothetical protein